MTVPEILFTSPVQPFGGSSADVYTWNKPLAPARLFFSFLNHPGLSFLKSNLPIDILEYPSKQQFETALQTSPDILGISFHINETEIALTMANQARARGVKEVWAGNYGSYNPAIANEFDRLFTGWSEVAVAEALDLARLQRPTLIHPELYAAIGMSLLPHIVLSGVLFTSRGCPWTCNFCQTPRFYGRAKSLPLEEIDRILAIYHARGIRGINILDENFGTFKSHARQVVKLLHKYGMRWIALSRVDTLSENFDYWKEHGLMGAHIGIESFNQASLGGAEKRVEPSLTVDLLRRLSAHHMFVQCFYIIGFEQDTAASVERDITELAELDVDVVQVQILTPYPMTPQRRSIEQAYGIFDHNLSKYNSRNLVWNHPNISPDKMVELQRWADRRIVNSRRALRTMSKLLLFGGREKLSLDGIRMTGGMFESNLRDLKKQLGLRIAAARQWSRHGWSAYEEYPTEAAITARPVPRRQPPIPTHAPVR
jgi:hypothetical protein